MNQLTLNEQFALRAQFQSLNFLAPQIAEYLKQYHIEKYENQTAKQLQEKLNGEKSDARSLFTLGCNYNINNETLHFYTSTSEKQIKINVVSIPLINKVFPYENLENFTINPNLYSLAAILFQASKIHNAHYSLNDIFQLINSAIQINNILQTVSQPEQLLKIFLSTSSELTFTDPSQIYFKQALAQSYLFLLNKQEYNVISCLLPIKANPLAPGLPYTSTNQFDCYFQVDFTNASDFSDITDILRDVLKLLEISHLMTANLTENIANFSIQYLPEFTPQRIYRGPLVTEKVACQQFKLLLGPKSEFRRFPNGEMRACVIFEEFESRDVFVEELLRYIVSVHSEGGQYYSFHTQKLEKLVQQQRDESIEESIIELKQYIQEANQNASFPFSVFDLTVGVNNVGQYNLNGFLSISGFGKWYYSSVGNQLLKSLIIKKLIQVLPIKSGFQLFNRNTHLEVLILTPTNKTLTLRLIILTEVDQIIQKSLSITKFEYLNKLQRSIISHNQLVRTLNNQFPAFSSGVALAKHFIASHFIPMFSFEPSLVDFLGIFNSPQLQALILRFQKIADEQNVDFESIFTEENLLENDLKDVVLQATQIVDFQCEFAPFQAICCTDMISEQLIEIVCALPFNAREFKAETCSFNSGLAVFRHFLKFFAWNQDREFEFGCKIDNTMEVGNFLRIAVLSDEEGTLFSNISERLYGRIQRIARIALNALDNMIFEPKFTPRSIFSPDMSNLAFIFTFHEWSVLPQAARSTNLVPVKLASVQQLQSQIQFDFPGLTQEFLRQIIPNLIKSSGQLFEVFYNKFCGGFVGFRAIGEQQEFRIQDLPESSQFLKIENSVGKFDLQRFFEEIMIENGNVFNGILVNSEWKGAESGVFEADSGTGNDAFLGYLRRAITSEEEEVWEQEEEEVAEI